MSAKFPRGKGQQNHLRHQSILVPSGGGGGGGVTRIFSYIRRLGSFFWVQNFEFQYFLGFSEN